MVIPKNQKSSQLTIVIMIDALRKNYIRKRSTPFLDSLCQLGISGELIPTFGFEPDAAYFAGLYPEECDGGMHYWYDPEYFPFKFTRYFPKWFDKTPELVKAILRNATKVIAQKISNHSYIKRCASTGRIPFQYLRYFDTPVKHFPFEPGFVRGETIFNILQRNNIPWFYHGSPMYRVNSDTVAERVKSALDRSIGFAYIHIGDLDKVGHIFGPQSDELICAIAKVDGVIQEIYNHLITVFEQVNLVVFGDHGMTEVEMTVNIWEKLEKTDLEFGKDFIFFLDSTMARFWFFNSHSENRVLQLLNEIPEGRILEQEDFDKYHLNYPHTRFGEIIFLANPKVLIFPNFFQNRHPVKGMHGYAPEFEDQHSLFIVYSSKAKPKQLTQVVDMRRMYSTILTLMNLDTPDFIKTLSLI